MTNFSIIQMGRTYRTKLDRSLRQALIDLYKPFKWAPCFMHKLMDTVLKRTKKLSIVVQFREENNCYEKGMKQITKVINKRRKCKLRKQFQRINCCTLDVTPAVLEELLNQCQHIQKVSLNKEIQALLDVAVPVANAKDIHINDTELTGEGVTIAVIDTGVHPHQDLEGRIVDFVDMVHGRTEPYDDNGHGTHCAGIAAGDGNISSGRYIGAAPKAKVIGVKVLNKMGSGTLEQVMEGVEWCIQYNEQYDENRIEVISMSLGSRPESYNREEDDPMVRYVNAAWDAGIFVCVAAGNDGPERGTIASPGLSRKVMTVGALDDKNDREDQSRHEIANFSSRGPTIYGEVKPDIVAPGVDIVSLRSPGSYMDKMAKTSRVGDYYMKASGTSMSTPLCAGIAALMLQYRPEWTPQDIKMRLMNGTDEWNDRDPNIYGAGYINAKNSIKQQ